MSRVRRYSRSIFTRTHAASPTGLSPSAVTRSSGLRLRHRCQARRLPSPPRCPFNPPQASPAGCAACGVWAPPRSLAATEGILSFPRGTEMFQFPRCPPELPQVPGRAPGGLPHSETPGSQAASASPGHFAAWPRPSSAANAKASTMRPSCGGPHPSPSHAGRRLAAVSLPDRLAPAGTLPSLPTSKPVSAPTPRPSAIQTGFGPSPPVRASTPGPSHLAGPAKSPARPGAAPVQRLAVVCFYVCVFSCSARGRPDTSPVRPHRCRCCRQVSVTTTPHRDSSAPAAAEPNRFRVALCQSAARPWRSA